MATRGIEDNRDLAVAMQEAGFEYSATEVGEVLRDPGKATVPFLVGLCEGLALRAERRTKRSCRRFGRTCYGASAGTGCRIAGRSRGREPIYRDSGLFLL